jgi:GNAT superfamily N-acetyltransferase
MPTLEPLDFLPLTSERWSDFEKLFGPRGGYGGCWCMWWRITRKEFELNGGEGNHQAMKKLVEGGEIPGILAYHEGRPVGWCSIAPRTTYGALERSPVLKRIDHEPVWSIVCFFVSPDFRHQGLSGALINAAVNYAARNGAQIVEAYPVKPKEGKFKPISSYMGLPSVFLAHDFKVVAELSGRRQILRRKIESIPGRSK